MSQVNIGKECISQFLTGHGTVGAAEAALSTIVWPVMKHVVVRASADNGNTVSVGPKNNSANGFILAAGEQTPPIYVDSTDKIFVIGGAADQDYSWIAN